jgi:hypothetical protein
MKVPRTSFKHLAFGLVAGAAMSVLPCEVSVLLGMAFLVIWIIALRRRPAGFGMTSYFVGAIAALVIVVTAILLPVKQLDRSVGPIHYERRSLNELCAALSREHLIFVSTDYRTGTNIFIAFSTDRPMTKREVLQKLAKDTDRELHIGYCGTGATFLFGAHPSFTRLDVKAVQDGPVNGSKPVRPE